MATDATGTPTSLGIPTFNVGVDAPTGNGSNAQMSAIDALIAARITLPAGVSTGDVPVWNGTTWVKPGGTRTGSNFLRDDGTWQPAGGFSAGMMIDFAGGTIPAGWLGCDGSAVSRTTYAALFAAIGTTHGSGDGSTTFNLPDSRDRVSIGAGGNTALGVTDGVAAANRHATRHRHSPHYHTYTDPGSSDGTGGLGGVSGPNAPGTHTGTADGGSGIGTDPLDGSAFIALNKIIKT